MHRQCIGQWKSNASITDEMEGNTSAMYVLLLRKCIGNASSNILVRHLVIIGNASGNASAMLLVMHRQCFGNVSNKPNFSKKHDLT